MALQEVWLQIEKREKYSPALSQQDTMRNEGHEDGTISNAETISRKLNALVFTKYTDETYTFIKPDKLIITDINEPTADERIGTVIYTSPGNRLKVHVKNTDTDPHSFHVHGLSYGIDSDGTWPFGIQNIYGQRSDEICMGEIRTFIFDITDDMIGCWPFHDYYRGYADSVNRGLFGGIIVVPSLESPWIPPDFELPSTLQDALDNPNTSLVTRKGINAYVLEMSESGGSQPDILPTDTIHAPIFIHKLAETQIVPKFNTGTIVPNSDITVNFSFVHDDIDLYYHCSLHPGMYGVVKIRKNSSKIKAQVDINQDPFPNFSPNIVEIQPNGTVTWTNLCSDNHTATEGNAMSFCFNGRCFIPSTPIIRVSQDQPIRFYVFNLDLGKNWHNFHIHGMRWKMPIFKFSLMNNYRDVVREDTRSIGPDESFIIDTVAPPVMIFDDETIEQQQATPPDPFPENAAWYDITGDFLFNCQVDEQLNQGLAGLVRVSRKIWLYDYQYDELIQTTGLSLTPVYNPLGPTPINLSRADELVEGTWEYISGGLGAIAAYPGVTMMHAILIPKTNKVLIWGYINDNYNTQHIQHYTRILDVDAIAPYSDTNNQPWQVVPQNIFPDIYNFANLWSAEHTYLDTDEGTILIHGGFTGMRSNQNYQGRQTFLFHPNSLNTSPWEFLGGTDPNNIQNMTQQGRYYSTTITLNDGRALTLFGKYDNQGATSPSFEIFDLNSPNPNNKWTQKIDLQNPNDWTYIYYPWTFLLPDGQVFISGPKKETRKFNYTTPENYLQFPGTIGDRDVDDFIQEGTSVLLPLRPADNYKARIIIAGGETPQTMNSLQIIDLSATNPQWTNVTPGLTYSRILQTNSVILPDGTVLICGGVEDTGGNQIPGSSEIFDPVSNTLSVAAANLEAHGYHSTAVLLPDGTVVFGGDKLTLSGDGASIQSERYKPWYYFTRRPIISDQNFPNTINYGIEFNVQVKDPNSIVQAALMSPGATTHGFNMTQRYIECTITGRDPSSEVLRILAPPNGFIAPPGWYLLFIHLSGNIPSIGKWIRLTT